MKYTLKKKERKKKRGIKSQVLTFAERVVHLGLKKNGLLYSISLYDSAVRTSVHRHSNLKFVVQVNRKDLEFESPGQLGSVKQFLLSVLIHTNIDTGLRSVSFVFAPSPV